MFRSYPYRDAEDLGRLKSLVAAIWQEEGPLTPFTVCDFDWRLHQHPGIDPTRRIRIWETARGEPVGFAWYTPPGDTDLVIAPAHREMSLFQPMLEWAIGSHREETGQPDEPGVWAVDADVSLPFLLQRLGFTPTARQYFHLLRDSVQPPEPPMLAEGYRLRHVRGTDELEPRVLVHRAAFAPARLTRESYRDLMQSAGYRNELDVVVETPDGVFGGFALGWLDSSSGIGQIEPVGTDPKHRGKGLARAATTELVRRLHARGATQITLYTHSDSLVQSLYHELGFRSVTRSQRYVKVSALER